MEHNHSSKKRQTVLVILFLSSVQMFALYYQWGVPSSLRQHLKEKMQSDDNFETKFQLLFSVVSLPNIFMPFCAGVTGDRIGGLRSLVLFNTICLMGVLLCAIAVTHASWPLLTLGRLGFGLGFESAFVSNQNFLVSCIPRRQIGMALAIVMGSSIFGQLSSFHVGPYTANRYGVAMAFWVAVIIKSLGYVTTLVLFALFRDKQTTHNTLPTEDKSEDGNHMVDAHESAGVVQSSPQLSIHEEYVAESISDRHESDESSTSESCIKATTRRSWFPRFGCPMYLLCLVCLFQYSTVDSFLNAGSGFFLEHSLFRKPPVECQLEYPTQCVSGNLAPVDGNLAYYQENQQIRCMLKDTYAPVLPQSLNVTTVGNSSDGHDTEQYSFNHLDESDIDCSETFWKEDCTKEYCDRQSRATETAGRLASAPYLFTVLTAFFVGRYAVDRWGLRAEMLLLASVVLVASHVMFSSRIIPLLLPLLMMGFANTLSVTTVWPSLSLLVPQETKATAIGLMTCIQNLGLTVAPLFTALVYNRSGEQ